MVKLRYEGFHEVCNFVHWSFHASINYLTLSQNLLFPGLTPTIRENAISSRSRSPVTVTTWSLKSEGTRFDCRLRYWLSRLTHLSFCSLLSCECCLSTLELPVTLKHKFTLPFLSYIQFKPTSIIATDGIAKTPFNIFQECIVNTLTCRLRIQELLLVICQQLHCKNKEILDRNKSPGTRSLGLWCKAVCGKLFHCQFNYRVSL
jgi:hypothetical protein